MTCETIRVPGGGTAIVCFSRRRLPQCSVPGCSAPGRYQCDAPIPGSRSGTCDLHICATHRLAQSPGIDFCPAHRHAAPRQGELFPAVER